MIWGPPWSTLLVTLVPYATLFRSLGFGRWQCDHLIGRVGPAALRHIGRRRCTQFEMIGAAGGVDDQVRHDVGAGRLDENMNAPRHTGAAQRVADDPADRIAGGDWSGSADRKSVV